MLRDAMRGLPLSAHSLMEAPGCAEVANVAQNTLKEIIPLPKVQKKEKAPGERGTPLAGGARKASSRAKTARQGSVERPAVAALLLS